MSEPFEAIRENRHEAARSWKKKTGGQVVGIFCCNVPEELIYAAGMLPVRLLGEKEEASEAELHFPSNCCPYPKRCFDQALKGRYDYLDGFVVPNCCDMIRAMYGTWKMSAPTTYAYFLEVPQKISASGVTFFRDILVRFKASLEEFSGRAISEEALADAIAVYNENRRLLHRAYDLRREGRLSGVECHQMVLAGMLMPKEEHNRLMADALNDVEKREPINDRVKLLVSASMLDRPDFLKLIEDCGGAIVADDMPVGSRYFFYPVGHASDALGSLAERYLAHIPCPRKMLPQDRFDYITEIIQGADVQGAVIHNLKACDCHLYEYPYLKKMLEDMGMPVLFFRGEETETEQETQRDDIEAFVEMIRG